VTPENVLGVRAIILEEAHGLQAALWQEERIVWLPKLGEDPVSKDMKREFNLVTKALMDRAPPTSTLSSRWARSWPRPRALTAIPKNRSKLRSAEQRCQVCLRYSSV
jgi:hypothetical protein